MPGHNLPTQALNALFLCFVSGFVIPKERPNGTQTLQINWEKRSVVNKSHANNNWGLMCGWFQKWNKHQNIKPVTVLCAIRVEFTKLRVFLKEEGNLVRSTALPPEKNTMRQSPTLAVTKVAPPSSSCKQKNAYTHKKLKPIHNLCNSIVLKGLYAQVQDDPQKEISGFFWSLAQMDVDADDHISKKNYFDPLFNNLVDCWILSQSWSEGEISRFIKGKLRLYYFCKMEGKTQNTADFHYTNSEEIPNSQKMITFDSVVG